MLHLALISSADPHPGGDSKASLSHLALMNMVIAGIENREKICGSCDDQKDMSEWKGVKVDRATHDVVEIDWQAMGLKGSIDLQWLPATVKRVFLNKNLLSGSVDLACLPAELKFLALSQNHFTGTVDLSTLPDGMEKLRLYGNKLSGSLELRRLPASLHEMRVNQNKFTGSVCLTELPAGLQHIDLSQNEFSANPTKGHLSVVGWTSTPVLGEAKNLLKPLVVFLSWRRPY